MAKETYFNWLSACLDPCEPSFEEARWIISEDVNAEHLLDVFTSNDANSIDVWDACAGLMRHLYHHKRRLTMLGPKIEGLPDGHRSKPECLYELAHLFGSVGNRAEHKRLLLHTLKLWRERGHDLQVAETVVSLSNANRSLGLPKEGIQQTEEAAEIYKRLNNVSGQVAALQRLALLFLDNNQLDAAEEPASRAMDLLSGEGD
jgi:hypothetical protein